MKRKKKITRLITIGVVFLLLFLFSIPFTVILINLYCQAIGLPPFVRDKIVCSLKEKGINIEIDEIKAGLLTGMRLQNVILKDNELPNRNLILAKNVRVEFDINRVLQGEFRILEVKVENGVLLLPLLTGDATKSPVLGIKDIQCDIEDRGDRVEIVTFSGSMGGVDVTLAGTVFKPISEDRDGSEFSLSVKPLLHYISPAIIDRFNYFQTLFESVETTAEVKINLDFSLPAADPAKGTLSADVFLSDVLFRGLNLKTLAFNSQLTGRRLKVDNFRLEFDDNEYLRGDFKLNLPTQEVSGRLSFYGYPYKILKAVSPDILGTKSIPIPEFEGAPLSAVIRVHPSPVSHVNEWKLDAKLTAFDIKFGNLSIQEVEGSCKFRDNRIHFDDIQARIAPDVDISMGGSYSIEEKRTLLKAEVIGDPNFLSGLIRGKKARKIYSKVWQDFQWKNGDRPAFYINMYKDLSSPSPHLSLEVEYKMSNCSYKGVEIEELAGQLFLGLPDFILVFDKLDIMIDGRTGSAALAWHGKPAQMEFDLKSNIAPPAVLGLFNRNWFNFLEKKGLVFSEPPDTIAHGSFSHGHPSDFEIGLELNGTNLHYKDALFNNFQGSMKIVDQLTTIETQIGEVLYEDWILDSAQAELLIQKGKTMVSGNVARGEGLGLVFDDTDFSADWKADNVRVSSGTRAITFGEWRLNQINGESVYDGEGFKSSGKIGNIAFRRIQFDSIATDFVVQDRELSADLVIDTASIGNDLEVRGIIGNLSLADNQAEMIGDIYELVHHPTNGVSQNVQARCYYSDASFDMHISADQFNCFDGYELSQIKANFSIDNGLFYGDYDVGTLTWGDQIRARELTGTLDGHNAPWSFHSRFGEISFPFCTLLKVTSTGSLSDNRFKSSVSSEVCKINRYTFENVSAAVTREKNNLFINRITGKIHGGRTTAELFYNELRKEGRIWLTAVDVDFEELLNSIYANSERQMGGKLSGKVDLNFSNQPQDLIVTGKGKILIDNGNLWKVPLISDFLQALSKMKIVKLVLPQGEEAGEITELSSDIEFQGNKVSFQNMKTNGNIVLIAAEGDYWWVSNELDFRVTAKPLNPLFRRFLPEAIDPFAILLERRLTGTLSDPKWEEVSAIRDLFRPKDEKTKQPPL